jgi:XRE family transcriptional regulator, aerobic/anaerobic benzoate catabolism transcriptional regulator
MNYSACVEERIVLQELGKKVRERRKLVGLTLKELAERASLSERFVSSLEGGEGNVSLLRLVSLARALECRLSDLVDDGWVTSFPVRPLGRPVALIGLRGAGKSTLGPLVAERLGVRFVELDQRIAQRAGMSIGEIFEVHGASRIRKLERDVWEALLLEGPSVVATTGGIVTESATYERLLATAIVVWLRAKPADHLRRVVDQGDTRPMQNRSDAMRDLEEILRVRGALYERAHAIVDTSALGVSRSVQRVVAGALAESERVSSSR